ncbi:helix-turn-helix domain-containing protein [uncultured Megasphaera sp.]|jgi:transcriptional regulator with XRE-family HTH domain|uniref:helix-turn-helix domain-containing protein n=1 Tax=uncultured Megasphaera sp. TaxID=165188 RepID=UPI00258BB7C4|nr:helix-turn-helix transcriptional regulator [uncultured Megasphaera sp.]
MSFGAKLKNCRKNMSLSQKEFGQKIGVAESTVSLYESNKRFPDADTLKKISSLFGVSIDYLLGNSPDPSPESGGYYTDPDVAQITEELRTDPDKRILFDATKDLSKDDINTVLKIIEGLKAREKE